MDLGGVMLRQLGVAGGWIAADVTEEFSGGGDVCHPLHLVLGEPGPLIPLPV